MDCFFFLQNILGELGRDWVNQPCYLGLFCITSPLFLFSKLISLLIVAGSLIFCEWNTTLNEKKRCYQSLKEFSKLLYHFLLLPIEVGQVELTSDRKKKITRKLKISPAVHNTIRNYYKNSLAIACGTRPKFIMADFSKFIPILTNIPLFLHLSFRSIA